MNPGQIDEMLEHLIVLVAYSTRRKTLEEAARIAEQSSPRHTECGNRIAAEIRKTKGELPQWDTPPLQ